MGMGEQNEIECFRLELESREILTIGFWPTLEETAIDNEFDAIGFNQIAGAGDFLRRT